MASSLVCTELEKILSILARILALAEF